MNFNKKVSTLIGIIIIVGIVTVFFGGAFVYQYFVMQKQQNIQVVNFQKVNNTKDHNSTEQSFMALTSQVPPLFIKNISTTPDIKLDLHYNGDYMPQTDWGWEQEQFYTPPGSNENFLSVSKVKDRQNFDYGSNDYLSLFKSQGSHSYQGTPIYISNSANKYSLSYLGFKISDKSLISELKVSLGIDYNAEVWDNLSEKNNNFSIASLLGVQAVSACGPGLYLRKVGDSALDFFQESNGIAWYKLRNPINMYNLSLQYSDYDCSKLPAYCESQADDPTICDAYWSCDYNATINDLTKGNLRMHVYYKANDKEGLLKMQMANFIVSDQNGTYLQTTMGDFFDHYYKAYLH